MADEKLMYPRPNARDFQVHRTLYELQEHEDLFEKFLADPYSVLNDYPIDDEAKKLIADKDFDGLERPGIHPIMIVQFQRHVEWGMRMTADRQAATSVTSTSNSTTS